MNLSLGHLGATYAVHLKLIRKPVVDFILVTFEGFFIRCYGLGATKDLVCIAAVR